MGGGGWTFLVGWWRWVEVYLGWVRVGEHFSWVGGGGLTFFMGGWGWAEVGGRIFLVGGDG